MFPLYASMVQDLQDTDVASAALISSACLMALRPAAGHIWHTVLSL